MGKINTYGILRSIKESGVSSDEELLDICEYMVDDKTLCEDLINALNPRAPI